MQATSRVVVALDRFKGLFHERPEVTLSLSEASKISGLEAQLCRALLSALVDVGFLAEDGDERYRRRLPLSVDDTRAFQ
jgi:DNA-binding IclR family transcriptional regulator